MKNSNAPHNRGFDEYFKHPHGDSSYYFSKYKDKISHSVLSRMGSCEDKDKYLTDILGMEAASFIFRNLHWRAEAKGKEHSSIDVIRNGNLKLIRSGHNLLPDTRKPGTYELYDLERDISERNNLVDEEPQVFESLREKITVYRNTVSKALW